MWFYVANHLSKDSHVVQMIIMNGINHLDIYFETLKIVIKMECVLFSEAMETAVGREPINFLCTHELKDLYIYTL